jgi:hypothetical protein
VRIYLDTSDLIDLLERDNAGVTVAEFREFLVSKNSSIVLSNQSINELIAPLWEPGGRTVVSRVLNSLEEMPHEWIDITRLPNREVQAALVATKAGTDYIPPDPFVKNYVATIINAPSLLNLYLNYPLSEIAFDLWRTGTFDPRAQKARHVGNYRKLIRTDRAVVTSMNDRHAARQKLLSDRIIERIRTFRLYNREDASNDALFENTSAQIIARPDWAPALKLVFATFHSLVDDVGDKLQDGDLGDLSHAFAVPYVDRFTSDRRISSHIRRACQTMNVECDGTLVRNIEELIKTN